MKKLVLEMIMLQPLSIRGIQELLQQHTLPASEIRCHTGWVTQVEQKTSDEAPLLPSQESLSQCLNLCGFSALKSLHGDELIKGLDHSENGTAQF